MATLHWLISTLLWSNNTWRMGIIAMVAFRKQYMADGYSHGSIPQNVCKFATLILAVQCHYLPEHNEFLRNELKQSVPRKPEKN